MRNKYKHKGTLILESGESVADIEIVYHTYGKLNENSDNVIWVFHAISADSDVMSWWTGLFGEGCIFDPDKYFIVCANTIGSPYGSTRPYDLTFPAFTVRDIVICHKLLAKKMSITKIHTAIGGSFGGYQALEFVYSFEGEIDHLILLATSAKESAWGIAIHETQRIAMKSDSTFGTAEGGRAGMKAARAIAMLTYRTTEAFVDTQSDIEDKVDDFKASSYIQYQGDKFIKRFNALCYYYLTKCIDSHNLGRNRGGEMLALKRINTNALVIGFTSDKLVPVRFQKYLAEQLPNAIYHEIESDYGHDGFLVEVDKISAIVEQYFQRNNPVESINKRVVLKFGGSSLYDKKALSNVLSIIRKTKENNTLAIIVSARGKSTNMLVDLFNIAKLGLDFTKELSVFIDYQLKDFRDLDIGQEIEALRSTLSAIQLLQEDNEFAHDKVVSFGEIISAKVLVYYLKINNIKGFALDARGLIFTKKVIDDFIVDFDKSRIKTKAVFKSIARGDIPVITGYIASSEKNRTVTLGRNGSNYSATLIANFIQAKEVQNWTDVRGVFSSDPSIVPNAVLIESMTYREANEMANFGANLLHPKTIQPLMQSDIPLVIKSTKYPNEKGTTISKLGGKKGIKAVSIIENVALVTIEGSDLADKIGIDARIFSALRKKKVSVKMISQASSERGIGFVISDTDVNDTELVLTEEFKDELLKNQISSIRINEDIGIIAILGRHNYALEKAISTLRENKIWMHLISNSISGQHISLVISKNALITAARLVHDQVY
ncbi:MAG: homoserine O-acetyltransferase [Saprospiraceae bacterium]